MLFNILTYLVFVFLIVFVFSPIVALFFWKKGFKQMWKNIAIISVCILLFLVTPILVLSYYTETKPLMDKMDKAYHHQENTLPKGNSTEKIFAKMYSSGGSTKHTYNVNLVVNNYNDKGFEGYVKVNALHGKDVLGTHKVKITLDPHEKGYTDYFESDKVGFDYYHNPGKIHFKYEVEGTFK